MKRPTLRGNGKKEITLKISFHLSLEDLAEIALLTFHGDVDFFPKTQQEFEERIRYYLYEKGCICETLYEDYTVKEVEKFAEYIVKLYPSFDWN